jgi:hypothetical protein
MQNPSATPAMPPHILRILDGLLTSPSKPAWNAAWDQYVLASMPSTPNYAPSSRMNMPPSMGHRHLQERDLNRNSRHPLVNRAAAKWTGGFESRN